MSNYDCITFHTAACDDHFDRLLNVHGPEGLDDVCPLCEIERLEKDNLMHKNNGDLARRGNQLLSDELKQANAVVEAARNLQSTSTLDNVFARDEKLRQALAALETCADGHDFRPFRGSAKCKDCGEMADCTETGAIRGR